MFNNLIETLYISKVKVILIEHLKMNPFCKISEELASALWMNQYRRNSELFKKLNGKRLNAKITAAIICITFIENYTRNGMIEIQGEDYRRILIITATGIIASLLHEKLTLYEFEFISLNIDPWIEKIINEPSDIRLEL